jgi:acetyl-CoA C-acetyltransferase
VNTGGATGASAAQLGWWAVASGRFSTCLVLGAETMGDNVRGAQEVLNKIWDPAYESLLPLNTLAMTGLYASRYAARHGVTEEHYAAIASRHRTNGALNPKAHLREAVTPDEVLASPMLVAPIRRAMACPRSTGGCALVLAAEDRARRLSAPKAWVRGFAARSNTYFMGDKMGDAGANDHGAMHEMRLAASEAYEMAGITDPARDLDVAEPYVPFAPMEPAAIEALGLCAPGEAGPLALEGAWDREAGRVAVCPSGGVMCANPISVSALARVAEGALQVRARAGEHQVEGARTAVVAGAGGSIQFFCVGVLSAEMAA